MVIVGGMVVVGNIYEELEYALFGLYQKKKKKNSPAILRATRRITYCTRKKKGVHAGDLGVYMQGNWGRICISRGCTCI